eukprot:6460916-Alexandrium_andersonii.AAC.1
MCIRDSNPSVRREALEDVGPAVARNAAHWLRAPAASVWRRNRLLEARLRVDLPAPLEPTLRGNDNNSKG